MMQAEHVSQVPGRSTGVRVALCALIGAMMLTSERASAVAVEIARIEWGSVAGVEAYNTFAGHCANAGGGGCPAPGEDSPVPNGNTLFGWGGANDPNNSVITWTSPGALGSFVLDRIEISMTQVDPPTALGSGKEGVMQGVGAAPVWEWSNDAADTQMVEAMIQIGVGGNDAVQQGLFSGFDVGETWYDTGNTLPTPVSFVFYAIDLVDKTISVSDMIEFRLYESIWNGVDQDLPDLVYAPMTIKIFGTRGDVPVPGTLVLLGFGLGALRLCRGRASRTAP